MRQLSRQATRKEPLGQLTGQRRRGRSAGLQSGPATVHCRQLTHQLNSALLDGSKDGVRKARRTTGRAGRHSASSSAEVWARVTTSPLVVSVKRPALSS